MAMNKAEKAILETLETRLALRFRDELVAKRVHPVDTNREWIKVWRPAPPTRFEFHPTELWFDGFFTSTDEQPPTGAYASRSHFMGGPLYATRKDALIATRAAIAHSAASALRRVDEMIAAEGLTPTETTDA